MLSYQHGYHAGNAADIHKHCVLASLWLLLKSKGRPLRYVESHSGRGIYDLSSEFSRKTGEFQTGIAKYEGGHEAFDRALAAVQSEYGKNCFPGSPAVISALGSDDDKLALCERHPREFAALKESFAERAELYLGDGFEYLRKNTPAKPRRGLVFIDPSYEIKSEYSEIPRFVSQLLESWPEIVIVIWYPILKANQHKILEDKLRPRGRVILRAEYLPSRLRMSGSAMMVINAPFPTAKVITEALEPIAPLYKTLRTEVLR